MYYVNKDLVNLDRIFDQNKRQGYLRLDLNENPVGLPQDFIDRTLAKVDSEFLAQYPETLEFTEFLADQLGTDITHLSLVNGSSEGIRNIIHAFTSPGGKIVGVDPSYAMFKVYAEMYGRAFVPVGYSSDLSITADDVISALDGDTELLVIVNPNNPVGNVWSEAEIDEMLAAARRVEATVLIDEAYHYFCPVTSIDYALSHEHVFVTRTFSKLFSLAGARLGYVAGWPEGIELVQKLATPHNVNAFALLFAREIMETPGMVEGLIASHAEGRDFICNWLDSHGYIYIASGGNFMFIKPHSDAKQLVEAMKFEQGILIKEYSGIGALGSCLRVTTGPRESMEQFAHALEALDLHK